MQHIAADQVDEHQHHVLQERFIDGANNRSNLAPGDALTFPLRGGFQDQMLKLLHDDSQRTGRTPDMLVEVQVSEKLAHGLCANATLEAKEIEDRHDQADQPATPLLGFPKPGLGMAMSALHGLAQTMNAAFGKAGLRGNLTNTGLGVMPNAVENQAAFSPESHVGRSSAAGLNSWLNLAP